MFLFSAAMWDSAARQRGAFGLQRNGDASRTAPRRLDAPVCAAAACPHPLRALAGASPLYCAPWAVTTALEPHPQLYLNNGAGTVSMFVTGGSTRAAAVALTAGRRRACWTVVR